jgi:hypothetical protein
MTEIALLDAVALTGKNESTLRRYFNKPENHQCRVIKAGKLFFDIDVLLKKYPAIKSPESPGQMPEPPRRTPAANARTPEYVDLTTHHAIIAAKDETIMSLQQAYNLAQEQLVKKDEQLSLQVSSYEHISREHNRIVHDFQNILKQLPEKAVHSEPEQKQGPAKVKRWKFASLAALVIIIICAIAFGVALFNGYRFKL